MAKIHLLGNNLINQICAGEVVERPASALKELIENSIDAKASKVKVELLDGGCRLIKVSDNGEGIKPEDLSLALQRHATSKIQSIDDLYQINSLGFRGEGLASIASISYLKLSSREKTANNANLIISNYGKLGELKPVSHGIGTLVEVQGIYHNIPARRKFLKSANTEYQYAKQMVERFSLSNPEIEFSLLHNEKEIFKLEPADLLTRISSLYGSEFSENYFLITELNPEISLTGYVYHPAYLNTNKSINYFFVNGRFVRDRVIQNAIKQAFNGILHHEHQASSVLFLNLPASNVDVNVHPCKIEVKFTNSNLIHSFIVQSLKKALSVNLKDRQLNTDLTAYSNASSSFKETNSSLKGDYVSSKSNFKSTPFISADSLTQFFNLEINPVRNNNLSSETLNLSVSQDDFSLGYPLAQLHGIFILSQVKDGLCIVDMHAAHERIIFERLSSSYQKKDLVIQELLIPLEVNLNEELCEIFLEYKDLVLDLGFDVSQIAKDSLLIKGMPALLKDYDLKFLVQQILLDLKEYGASYQINQTITNVLATKACHLAVRAHDSLDFKAMDQLLRDLETTIHGEYCNHGRPTWIKLTINELNNFFMRGK